MKILAIETSCDETAMAVLEIKGKKNPVFSILSNIVSSQVKIHAKYGGVYPFLAKMEHQKNLPFILKKTLRKANFPIFKEVLKLKFQKSKIDLIAVTAGPGLEPCLWTGINFAQNLAQKNNLKIVAVNHIEAHIATNFIGGNSKFKILNSKQIPNSKLKISKINFPAVCLVVSGGHTQLVLMKEIGKYQIIGETRDDAAGECFDKTARILGLSYPGGPIISQLSKKSKSKIKINLPRPMIQQKNYDFSFSGLKTAVLYKVKDSKLGLKDKKYIQAMCKEIQQAIIDVLIHKTLKAAKNYKAKSIILSGGVAANNELRKQFQSTINSKQLTINFLVPPKKLCTDNAVMVGIAAYLNRNKNENWKKIKANANLKIGKYL